MKRPANMTILLLLALVAQVLGWWLNARHAPAAKPVLAGSAAAIVLAAVVLVARASSRKKSRPRPMD